MTRVHYNAFDVLGETNWSVNLNLWRISKCLVSCLKSAVYVLREK